MPSPFTIEKGIQALIEVAKSLPEVCFIIAGNRSMEERIVGFNIHKVSFVKGGLLQVLMKNVEFVISPSVCTETFRLSNGEAIKHGIPVIITDIGALPEMITHENGSLVQPGDTVALARTVKELRQCKDKLDSLKFGCINTELLNSEQYETIVSKIYS